MVDEICNIIESSSLDDVRRMAKYKQQWINLISDAIRKNASITTLSQARTFIRFFYCGTVIQFIIIKATIWYLLQFNYSTIYINIVHFFHYMCYCDRIHVLEGPLLSNKKNLIFFSYLVDKPLVRVGNRNYWNSFVENFVPLLL